MNLYRYKTRPGAVSVRIEGLLEENLKLRTSNSSNQALEETKLAAGINRFPAEVPED